MSIVFIWFAGFSVGVNVWKAISRSIWTIQFRWVFRWKCQSSIDTEHTWIYTPTVSFNGKSNLMIPTQLSAHNTYDTKYLPRNVSSIQLANSPHSPLLFSLFTPFYFSLLIFHLRLFLDDPLPPPSSLSHTFSVLPVPCSLALVLFLWLSRFVLWFSRHFPSRIRNSAEHNTHQKKTPDRLPFKDYSESDESFENVMFLLRATTFQVKRIHVTQIEEILFSIFHSNGIFAAEMVVVFSNFMFVVVVFLSCGM